MNEKLKEGLRLLEKYQIGETYYYILDNKIKAGEVIEINFDMRRGISEKLDSKFKIVVTNGGGSKVAIEPTKLFNTKADLAEQFLKDNDVPSDLLRAILIPDELVFRQNNKDVATLTVSAKGTDPFLETLEKTDEYWDCECEKRYIHSVGHDRCPKCDTKFITQPYSRKNEVKPENMYREEE